MRPTVVILTFNSRETLGATLRRARSVSDEIFVVDSYSSDRTTELAASLGAIVVQHKFEHYGAQRNWAIDNLPVTNSWQLHLDADEAMDERLIAAIRELPENPECNGYLLARYVRFLGRILRHGGMSPTWHLRLFRTGVGRCEDRKYDQHFFLKSGRSARLPGVLVDDVQMSLSEWTLRHNRWSDGEISEISDDSAAGRLTPNLFGSPPEQKRFFRGIYNRLPLFVRPLTLFIYRYFARLGILDGTEGLIFWVLQTFWFRFLIDAKLWERKREIDRLNEDTSQNARSASL
jgi:glycosyltransferase involved in cell wall biosynthesis